MTEWDAAEYSRRSGLQEAMAQEVLALLDLEGSERVLDVGCGDGLIGFGAPGGQQATGERRCKTTVHQQTLLHWEP